MKKPIRFRYSNGFSVAIVTENSIKSTDYWPNEVSDDGRTLSDFVMNSKPGDKWIRGFERLQKMA